MQNKKKLDPKNVIGVYVDEEEKTQYIFTKDQLVNQLQKITPEIAASFDNIYWEEFQQLSTELSGVLALQFVGMKAAKASSDETRIYAANLLRNAGGTVIAAIDSLRNGFRLQSGILLRSIIEISATVFQIMSDPGALAKFKADQLESTKCISFANRQIPLFGKPWGLLSNFHIHINTVHADWYPMHKYENKDEIPTNVVLGILGYTMLVLEVLTEMVFIHETETPKFWKIVGPDQLQFLPPKADRTEWMEKLLQQKVLGNP